MSIREQRPGYYVADLMRDGHRVRKGFRDLSDAKLWAEQKRAEIQNKGTAALGLSDRLRVEVAEALRRLNGRATIAEAVDEWLRRHPETPGENVAETGRRYVAGMRAAGRRDISVQEKALKYDILAAALGNPPTAAIDLADLRAAVDGLASVRQWTRQTAEAYMGAGRTLLRFYRGEARQWRHADETPPVTWTVEQVAALLSKAEEIAPSIAAPLAVLAFAGLRPHEMLRLDWDRVDLAAGLIHLDGAVTKTRTMRHVEIAPNLREWLVAYRGTGLLVPSADHYRAGRERVMRALGLTAWPVDVLRHTAATAHYNAHGDAAKTMAMLGHFGSASVFTRHYKGQPIGPAEAARYFSIRPIPAAPSAMAFAKTTRNARTA